MLACDSQCDRGHGSTLTDVARCFLVVLFCGGACLACGPLRQDGTSDSETQRRPIKNSVPIVYQSERFTPIPLTPQQIDEFVSIASKAMPTGPSVWFILVRRNSKHDGELSYNVTVYFTPDETTARLRQGRYLHLSNWANKLAKVIEKAFGERSKDPSVAAPKIHETDWTKRLRSYYQVSISNQPFGKELDAPEDSLLPFDVPVGFTGDEVIDIVDFVRSDPLYTPSPSKAHANEIIVPMQFDGSDPIVAIEKEDCIITVRTGTVEGPLSGIGDLLRCVRDGEEFVIIGTGMWVY